jgi:hypothetical protein
MSPGSFLWIPHLAERSFRRGWPALMAIDAPQFLQIEALPQPKIFPSENISGAFKAP